MSNLKFRAFDGKDMRYDVTGFEHGKGNEMEGVFLDGDFYVIHGSDLASKNHLNHNVAHVMQFTGLKDFNGVDIYEGDLVEFQSGWDSHVCSVRYCDCKFTFGVQLKGSLGINYDSDLVSFTEGSGCNGYIVIGNIHQNTEMVGVKDA